MNRNTLWTLGAVTLLALGLAAYPAAAQESSPEIASAVAAQASAQAQAEVQAALAAAQAEIARAMAEVNAKVNADIQKKVQKQIAAKLAANRGALLADLKARQAELAALAQEKASREVGTQVAQVFTDSEGGWLGVQITDVDADKVKELKLPAERGVLITDVEKDSPAEKAGLKVNDVITEFNGQRVESSVQFRRMVRESLAGRAAQLVVWRDARSQNLSVTLGSNRDRFERSFTWVGPGSREFRFNSDMFKFDLPNIVIAGRTPLLGISAEDLSGQLGNYFGAPGGEGILVREVNSGSPADKAGMKAGDVITKVNGERVKSLEELREKLRAKRESKTVSIGVIRKGTEVSLNVEVEQPKLPERKRIARRTSL